MTLGRLVGLGAAVYVIVLIATLPARLVWPRLPDVPAAELVAGTVWQGRANGLDLDGLRISALDWSLRPSELLGGRLGADVDLRLPGGFARGRVALTPGGTLTASGLELAAPLPVLGDVLPLAGVEGDVIATFDRLTLDTATGRPQAVAGTVRIGRLSVRPLGGQLLGDFQLVLDTTAEGITGRVSDLGGPLQVEGQLLLDPAGAYEVEGRLKTRSGAPRELESALRLLGSPDPGGFRPFALAGRL